MLENDAEQRQSNVLTAILNTLLLLRMKHFAVVLYKIIRFAVDAVLLSVISLRVGGFGVLDV